ncbi:MAG TPA: hypothetical protein VE135_28510 [Pyrinomonadaceae bacterium]|nr:hypothetical protein [Pyrinomonadaceae bacterium]
MPTLTRLAGGSNPLPNEVVSCFRFLQVLRVLGVSVVEHDEETAHHGDTEDTEMHTAKFTRVTLRMRGPD